MAPPTTASRAVRSTFLPLVPEGWLRTYMEAMVEADNEMPLPFHFLAGAVTIGQMLGLRTWATLARGVRVFPNINGMLLSPAGACRRGEGTKITMRLARDAGINVFAGKTTPEGLLDELMEHGDTLLYVEELSLLLTKQDFQRPIISVLTKALLHGEGQLEMRSRSMGKRYEIPFVNLSALFTSAPDWFMSTIPEEAYGGGMMSRFLVCCLDRRDVYSINIQADDCAAQATMLALSKELQGCSKVMEGHLRGETEAQRWIEKWYIENETRVVEDERHEAHRNRKPANVLRLAIILAAAAFEPTLNKRRLEQALAILDWMEPTLTRLYGLTDETASSISKGEKRILMKLATEGEITHSDLLRACGSYFKGGTKEMRYCLEGLVEKRLVIPKYKVPRLWPPSSWSIAHETRDG